MVSLVAHPLVGHHVLAWANGERSPGEINIDIYVMPPAGGDTQRLTTDPGRDVSPIWSPTSMSIAFLTQEQGDWDVAVVNASGGAPRRLTSTPGFEGCHAWPDGQSIAYCYVLVQQDLVRAGLPVCPTKLASSLIFAIQR